MTIVNTIPSVLPCDEGSFRLSGGLPGTNNTGLVEMCIRNVWTAVCDTQFDIRSAQLLCGQLGLPTGRKLMDESSRAYVGICACIGR